MVERRAGRVDECVAELATLVDAPRGLQLTWLGTPPGDENWRKRVRMPSASSATCG